MRAFSAPSGELKFDFSGLNAVTNGDKGDEVHAQGHTELEVQMGIKPRPSQVHLDAKANSAGGCRWPLTNNTPMIFLQDLNGLLMKRLENIQNQICN